MATNWAVTNNRYIAFFDIMGFKEFVERNSHTLVVKKLQKLKASIGTIEQLHNDPMITKEFKVSESKIVTFSDSIIIFSKDDSVKSLTKILLDASIFIYFALQDGVPIKGALSHGKVTVDFKNSLFFGRPIIDAYLLHDQLQMYTAVLDHNIENKIQLLNKKDKLKELITPYKANFKSGKVKHTLIRPPMANFNEEINFLERLYTNVSGTPRIYIDNTIDFLKTLDPN